MRETGRGGRGESGAGTGGTIPAFDPEVIGHDCGQVGALRAVAHHHVVRLPRALLRLRRGVLRTLDRAISAPGGGGMHEHAV